MPPYTIKRLGEINASAFVLPDLFTDKKNGRIRLASANCEGAARLFGCFRLLARTLCRQITRMAFLGFFFVPVRCGGVFDN